MTSKVSRPLHLPRRSKAHALRLHPRAGRSLACGYLLPLSEKELGSFVSADGRLGRHPWLTKALREGLVATLLTTLLTSAVLAAPEVFRQSPSTTWRQWNTPALATGQLPHPGLMLDCP
jgi:hypothetical protein